MEFFSVKFKAAVFHFYQIMSSFGFKNKIKTGAQTLLVYHHHREIPRAALAISLGFGFQ